MGSIYQELSEGLTAWLHAQRLFFVATAPSGDDGHVNCSPRGGDSFRALDASTVAWLDLTGSGVETIAHLRQNGRVALMFCAFEGAPRIVRLHGRGEVVRPDHAEFGPLLQRFGHDGLGVRAVIRVAVTRVAESCGYGVPLMSFVRERDTLRRWAEQKGADGVASYQAEHNAASIDGLPGL